MLAGTAELARCSKPTVRESRPNRRVPDCGQRTLRPPLRDVRRGDTRSSSFARGAGFAASDVKPARILAVDAAQYFSQRKQGKVEFPVLIGKEYVAAIVAPLRNTVTDIRDNDSRFPWHIAWEVPVGVVDCQSGYGDCPANPYSDRNSNDFCSVSRLLTAAGGPSTSICRNAVMPVQHGGSWRKPCESGATGHPR